MKLTPEMINRLVAVKSLLGLEDWDLVVAAAERLESAREQEEIASILEALDEHRYAEAAQLIDKILSDGTRLAEWRDPEISLLEAELARVTEELADLEINHAETEHRISRFQAAHNKALGEHIAKVLDLRRRLFKRAAKDDPGKEEDYQKARRDFEEFQQDQEAQQEADSRTEWELSEEEQRELKKLFRRASKKCHPDMVSAEHQQAATEMFRELRDAYDEGDLVRLKKLVKRVETGLFDVEDDQDDNAERKKERLKARIEAIRDALEKTRREIGVMKQSSTYQLMVENEDWDAVFEEQAELLKQEIESLTAELEATVQDS